MRQLTAALCFSLVFLDAALPPSHCRLKLFIQMALVLNAQLTCLTGWVADALVAPGMVEKRSITPPSRLPPPPAPPHPTGAGGSYHRRRGRINTSGSHCSVSSGCAAGQQPLPPAPPHPPSSSSSSGPLAGGWPAGNNASIPSQAFGQATKRHVVEPVSFSESDPPKTLRCGEWKGVMVMMVSHRASVVT